MGRKQLKLSTLVESPVFCLQAVEAVPLPEGVPEVLHVNCNGRSGRLVVRTQRVLQGEAEMSASKFEQVCGKGDAKKWKCSIWTEGPDGEPLMVSCCHHVCSQVSVSAHRKCNLTIMYTANDNMHNTNMMISL